MEEGGEEGESGTLPSDLNSRDGAKDARERGRVTPTSNKQPQPQHPTPQRDRCIMQRTRVVSPGPGRGEQGRRSARKKKLQKSCRRDVENKGDLGR